MSDFEQFAAFFGNLIDPCRCHNGLWDLPPRRFVAARGAAWKRHGSAS
ncbi:hypothetical protein ParKJ_10805 [Paraburkholderia fungorum]|uniref:Uncharacterized protein n=1 Tax=Paraburkholderia fungorum TaxID=134537 RepID=A0AAP5Q964_9BURK|nr:hypothetical protein [Paraburkholderia fungorum]MDT8837902.1 hypothetical protein [Paraburkholderia fungorum]